jgi:hypothetical protein
MMSNPGRKEAMGKEPARKGGKTRPNIQSNQGPGTSESTGRFALGGNSNSPQKISRKLRKKMQLGPNDKLGFGGKITTK